MRAKTPSTKKMNFLDCYPDETVGKRVEEKEKKSAWLKPVLSTAWPGSFALKYRATPSPFDQIRGKGPFD